MRLLTWRLALTPVAWADAAAIATLKADPRAFAPMLGGVRTDIQARDEMAADQAFWAREGVGMWTLRDRADNRFVGLAGIMDRPDGRGLSLRYAVAPEAQGHGLAREAAGAVLHDALDRAGVVRVVAVTRADNHASRTILGALGMRVCERFLRDGTAMEVFQIIARSNRPG